MPSRTSPLREAVLDRWAENRTASEIAEATGASLDSIRAMVVAARAGGDPRAIRHQPGSPPKWTPGLVARLSALWAEGRTCSEIARDLGAGTTRNAVIGKVHRLKLPPRIKEPRDRRPRRAASGVLIAARIRARAEAALAAAGKGIAASPLRGGRKCELQRALSGGGLVSHPHPKSAFAAASADFDLPSRGRLPDAGSSIPPAPDSRPVTLLERGERQCAFVPGEVAGGETVMCGAPASVGESYCAYHAAIVYAVASPAWSAERRARFWLARARRQAAEAAAAARAPAADKSEEVA
jgi:GcrA cell cycle regulator